MSSFTFPFILFLVGLNFINALSVFAETGPSHRFAEELDGAPEGDFFDLFQQNDVTWLAGEGIYRLVEGSWDKVIDDERVTALTLNEDGTTLWYSGVNGISRVDLASMEVTELGFDPGYVWALEWHLDRVWFITSENYGWIWPEDGSVGGMWQERFQPRPFVSRTHGAETKIFIGSDKGLWQIAEGGAKLVLPLASTDGKVVPWVGSSQDGFLLGTNASIYQWSGLRDELPVRIDSNYGDYFLAGISNAVDLDDYVAITEYPVGVAVWDRSIGRISEYITRDEKNDVGDIFKVEAGDGDSLYILGDAGVAAVDLSLRSRYFPFRDIYKSGEIRSAVAGKDAGYLFSDSKWIRISEEGYEVKPLPRTADWVGLEHDGDPIHGAVNAYQVLRDGDWELHELPIGIFDFKWGAEYGYALGGEGLYAVSKNLEMDLILPEKGKLRILGEFEDTLYVISGKDTVLSVKRGTAGWAVDRPGYTFEGEIIGAGDNASGIWLATKNSVYRIGRDGLSEMPLGNGWEVKTISALGNPFTVLFENPLTREWSVGLYEDSSVVMLSVPYMDYIGEPVSIMNNTHYLGIVGSGGVGWYHMEELPRVEIPRVDFALLFEDKRIEDRTIPSGMHFIELQISFNGPFVPCQVQYRINDQRWRNVSLQDPSLQFAGHGSFSVELRAVHPNGKVSPSKVVQFGIAPPWYLNPLYQGIMLVLLVIVVYGLYYLRSAQLKRTNLWLQSEVKKQTRELEAATAARTNFLAGLSHDIRNPLNGVLMIAETLSRKPPQSGDDPRLADLTEFGIIVDRMLGEILDFSAIDQEKIPTSMIPVSVKDIVESSVKQNQFGIQHEMVTLETSIDPELRDVIIRTDRNWMIKVLSNLIVNALEYSESERIEIGARCLHLSESEVQMELHVADWGIGIDDSEKEFVFERFYRGESGIESGKHGTGLGLSICQEIAHAMGGHIRIENNEPSGCRFVLMGRFDRMEGASELDKEAVLASLAGQRILIVDDLVYNRRSIVDFFQTIGCLCDEAESGHDALDLLQKNSYYLALLDWDLPGLTGPEIARRYRRKMPNDPVIMVAVTAYTDGEKKRESEEAGMNGYISKPLTATRLAHCLANIQNWNPEEKKDPDVLDTDEVMEEIYKHIEDCLHYGEHYEWENLRRCAHRLTTLAMIKNNRAMQQVCRDLQIAAKEGDIRESQIGLLELHKWRKT